jgi:N-hydroxyarylamine O-acetyltransferase
MLIGLTGQVNQLSRLFCLDSGQSIHSMHTNFVEDYLKRINIPADDITADLPSLRLLQRQHLINVPFENLDIHWKRPIVLDVKSFFEKIVTEGRGGFCYELNGLFNELLRGIGFRTRLVSARVSVGEEDFGPEFDHAAIIVTLEEGEYLADVGFGDFAVEPLRMVIGEEQHDPSGTLVIRRHQEPYLEVAKLEGKTWKSEYIFSDVARGLSDFVEMCDFQQYSPESHFVKGKVCSVLTDNGRKTLTDTKFKITQNGQMIEESVDDETTFDQILRREFNIGPPGGTYE